MKFPHTKYITVCTLCLLRSPFRNGSEGFTGIKSVGLRISIQSRKMDEQKFKDLKSHEGKKLHRQTVKTKLDAVNFAAFTNNRSAAERCDVDERSIHLWRSQKTKLKEIASPAKRWTARNRRGDGRVACGVRNWAA